MKPLLGTFVEVAVDDGCRTAVPAAFDIIEVIQQRLSFHNPDSELSKLNLSPGQWVAVSKPTLLALRLARYMTRVSGGSFNCFVGGNVVAKKYLPDHGFGSALVGEPEDLELGRGCARLKRSVQMTLDGIAKGLAVDLAVRALKKKGVKNGWINAGGDLRVFGAVKTPILRRHQGRLEDLGEFENTAVATSAVEPEAASYLVDQNGQSIPHGIWTVVARSAWLADALTKVACNGGAVNRWGAALV